MKPQFPIISNIVGEGAETQKVEIEDIFHFNPKSEIVIFHIQKPTFVMKVGLKNGKVKMYNRKRI